MFFGLGFTKRPATPKDPRRAFGRAAERWVAVHYWLRGYRVLARNEQFGGVEVDLVAWRAGMIVVIEVKSRREPRSGTPSTPRSRAADAWTTLAVGREQRRRLLHAATTLGRRPGVLAVRIDLAFVERRRRWFLPPRIGVAENGIALAD